MQVELNSLRKRDVFEPVVQTPKGVKLVTNEYLYESAKNNEIIRYKMRLVAQGFSQKLGIDYKETYSPVIDTITFRSLLNSL